MASFENMPFAPGISRNRAGGEVALPSVIGQLLSGLHRLHVCDIVHNDIKPANSFLSTSGIARLGDLGSAFVDRAGAGFSPPRGTSWYSAPEALLGSVHYGVSADLWSMGCTMAELAVRRPLFTGQAEGAVLASIFRQLGKPTEEVSREMRRLPKWSPLYLNMERSSWPEDLPHNLGFHGTALLLQMLGLCAQSRPSAHTARMHAFFFPATAPFPEICQEPTGSSVPLVDSASVPTGSGTPSWLRGGDISTRKK